MVLKLYGSPSSGAVRLVAFILREKEVPFELVPIDFSKKEHKSPEYLEKQPFGQVPYIDDDGFILYESRAICYYIAAKYPNQGTSLLPTELKANALFHQAASVEIYHFSDNVLKAAEEMVLKPMRGLQPDKEAFEKHIAALALKLDVYEKILSKQKYVAGDEITLVDLYHVMMGDGVRQMGSDVLESESRPNVKRWFKEISSRPVWLAIKDVDVTSNYVYY